ncbi:YhdP family protein [Marinomonas sp. 2405UD66-6]|uniref:YhdP family protein n=1 Tax=Marinomonas sp. 2405UD66-6 TaxID=3391834 RepID=UPI0039C8F7F2
MSWLLRKTIVIAFWVLVTFTALLAIFSLSVANLLPYLDHYRPQIENNLEQITGYPISLGSIDGRLEGIDPTISVGDFQLSVNSKPSILVNEMRVRLDTVKSLLSLSPQFTYIRFVEPVVSLQESEGQWRLNGAKPSRTVRNDVGIERALDYLSEQRNFSIIDASVEIHSDQFGEHILGIPHLYIFQKSFGSLLTSTFYLDGNEAPFQIDARLAGYSGLLGNYRIKASLDAPLFSLPIKEAFQLADYSVEEIETGGKLWFDVTVGKEVELRSQGAQFNISFADGRAYQTTSSLRLRYAQTSPSLHVDLYDLEVNNELKEPYPTTNLSFDWSSLSKRSNIRFDQIDLGMANQVASYFLPEESDAQSILSGLNPTGVATNGALQIWQENDQPSFQFLSNFQSASVDAYNGIPKATGVNAVFSLSNDSGYIDFKGQMSQLHFDTVYDSPWFVDALSGYVSWQKQQDTFLIVGKGLNVERNAAHIQGGFRLEIRKDEPDWISLDLHGDNIPTSDRLSYIPPKALNEDLRQWIDSSFADAGMVSSADVLLHSELSDGADPHVRVQLAARDLSIQFDENWPVAEQVSGAFEFDNKGISVNVDSAVLSGLSASDIKLSVPIVDNAADWLNIKARVKDDSATIISMLKETPLNETIVKPFENWDVTGEVSGSFDVSVPFSHGQDPKVQVSLNFENNPVTLKDLNLPTVIKKGQLNYTSAEGIQNSEFQIQGLGGESRLSLTSNNTFEGELAISGDLSGVANLRNVLEWRELPDALTNAVSGNASYNGTLSINQSQSGQLDLVINSDLLGVNVALPKPVGKKNEEAKPLNIKLRQHEDDLVVDLNYSALSNSRFLMNEGEFVGGEVIMNGEEGQSLSDTIPKGLVLNGNFDYFDVQEWFSVFNKLSSDSVKQTEVEVPQLPTWINKVNLIIDDVEVNPYNTLRNFKVSYDASKSGALLVSSDELNFSYTNESQTPNLHFGFLSWNTAPSNDDVAPHESENVEAPISAYQVPNINLSVDELYLNEKPYGDWQLAVKRNANKVSVEPIATKLKSGTFSGRFVWVDAGEDSTVELSIGAKGKDIGELAGKFSNESYLSSKAYQLDVDLNWKGHPFYFDRSSVSGGISFSADDGNFHKVDELPSFLKALGIFNIGALSRRLVLDFSDIYEPGLTYDDFNGVLSLNKGILTTTKPIKIVAPSAELVVEGKADIVNETLDEKLTATFPLTGTLPLAGLLLSTPQIAGLLFITDKLIGDQLSKVTSVQYKVEGSFNDPVITPIKYRPLEKK